nr:hypothetical protein [Tanacetum cinerariifolium]
MHHDHTDLAILLTQIDVDTLVQANQLLHHEVEGRVDGLVEEVEELENQLVELVDELVIKMVKVVTDGTELMEALTKSLTSSWYIYGLASQICGMGATMKPTTIQSAIVKARGLTDEAIRNVSLRKNTEKRGNSREPSRVGNVKDDNKRSRTGRVFDTTTNPVRKEYTDLAPKCANINFYHYPEMPFTYVYEL